MLLIVYLYLARRRARLLKSPVADISIKKRFRRHNDRIAILLLKFAVSFFGGYYLASFFGDADFFMSFPRIIEKVDSIEGTTWITRMAVEVFLISGFYSVFFPLWSKIMGYYVQELCAMYMFNVYSSTKMSIEFTRLDAEDRFVLRDGNETNLTTTQISHASENVLVTSMLVINFWLDITRFVYGRCILFKLSRIELFFLIVFKDFCYQVWHFGFKYVDWVVVFTLKAFHQEGLGKVSFFWQTMAKVVECVVRVGGIPKILSATWTIPINYAALKNRGGDKTPHRVRLTFCNVALMLTNLPDSFKDDLLLAANRIKAELQLIHANEDDSDDFRTEQSSKRGHNRGELLEKMDNEVKEEKPERACSDEGMTASKLTGSKKLQLQLATIEEEPPVTEDDKENFKGIISIIQAHIFMRYQIRAAAKTFTAFVFLFAPLIAGATPSKYHAFFGEIEFFGDGEVAYKYRFAAITFLLVDLFEWALLTSVIIRKSACATPMTKYLHALITGRDRPFTVMCLFAAFSGIYMLHIKLRPFSFRAINGVLGSTTEWTDWGTIYEKCFNG